jgi:hypothetical protein
MLSGDLAVGCAGPFAWTKTSICGLDPREAAIRRRIRTLS